MVGWGGEVEEVVEGGCEGGWRSGGGMTGEGVGGAGGGGRVEGGSKTLSRKCSKSCCFRKKLILVVLFATLRAVGGSPASASAT